MLSMNNNIFKNFKELFITSKILISDNTEKDVKYLYSKLENISE